MESSPYFEIKNKIEINNISELLELNRQKTYGQPGIPYEPPPQSEGFFNSLKSYISFIPYDTSGLFRGQSKDWPLLPSSYRGFTETIEKDSIELKIRLMYSHSNSQLRKFSQIASNQHADFPVSKIEQMIIAQHYGIKTPLLDWTTNIFVAVYFALDFSGIDKDENNLNPYIYHITDERLLNAEVDQQRIELFDKSTLVKPLPIDRRIERQFSTFTFHPLPFNSIKKIPIIEYKIPESIFMDLRNFMQGLGFTSYHYFPDYAGIAEKIKAEYL